MRVLFIAKNIPRPTKKTNKIILTIAEKLSDFCDITFLRPREKIPFWLKSSKKFGDLYGLKGWKYKNFNIITYPYFHSPFKKTKYWLLNGFSRTGKSFLKKNQSFDLAHAHYLLPDGYIAYQIFKHYSIPYIVTVRSQDKQYLETLHPTNPDYKKAVKILSAAKQILVTNGGYKEFLESTFGIDCVIMPHGIETEVFHKENKSNKKNEIIILSVADTLSTKNVDWVIRAFKAYTGDNKVKLRLIGDVCTRKDIIELSANNKRIELLGKVHRDEVLQHMAESNIFALPSSKETFGLVYLEAAATRNAIIGFKEEGVWGVFEEDKEMLFSRNFEQFEHQLHQLIKNQDLRNSLTQNAFVKAKTMAWEKVKKNYFQIYSSSITES